MYGDSTHLRPQRAGEAHETRRHEPTKVVELFMAGDVEHAKQVIRRFCMDCPCCVTVTPTTYVYRGGQEDGFVVGFRNYPRFPSDAYGLRTLAADLGDLLRRELAQDSYMVVDHGHAGMTSWSSMRPDA